MIIDKATGGFVKAEHVKTGDLIKFLNEGQEVTKEFKGKEQTKLEIGVELANGRQMTLSMNGKSRNAIIEYYGRDTKEWIGKEAHIEIIRQSVGGDIKDIVYVTPPGLDVTGKPLF